MPETPQQEGLSEETKPQEPVSPVIELSRGYKDPSGGVHKRATLRLPLMSDHLRASAMVRQYASGKDKDMQILAQAEDFEDVCYLSICLVSLGEIQPVTPEHLVTLSRYDFFQALNRLAELEDQDVRDQKKAPAKMPAKP